MLIVFNFYFVTLTEDCIIVLVMGKSPCGKLSWEVHIHLFHHHEANHKQNNALRILSVRQKI